MSSHRHHSKKHEKKECPKPIIINNFINENKCNCLNITPQPVSMTINFDNLTTNYVNATVSPLSIFGTNPPTNPIICWCGQYDVNISVSQPYNTVLVSSYDPKLLSVLSFYQFSCIQYNIKKINYILNRKTYYESAPFNYNYGDIQTAIWRILDDPNYIPTSVTFTPAHVTAIMNDANTNGINYIPTQITDYCVIFAIPLSLLGVLLGNPYQVMLLPIQLQNLINSPLNCGLN